LGGLVRAAFGCYDFAKAFGVPFISGKDSLYNEYSVHGESVAIPGTLLISAIAMMEDINKVVSMYAKQPGNLLYVVGPTYNELGGSHYYELLGASGNVLPKVYPETALNIFNALAEATSKGLIRSIHDCSEGGIGVASAEMAFAGGLGMEIFLEGVPYQATRSPGHKVRRKNNGNTDCLRNDFVFFSESNSRFIVEVEKSKQKAFEDTLKGVDWGLIGSVLETQDFKVYGLDSKICVRENIYNLKESWQKPLRW
jgi:phosphoribosylformylglycinamidine (FGAM) synthase-like enzyme